MTQRPNATYTRYLNHTWIYSADETTRKWHNPAGARAPQVRGVNGRHAYPTTHGIRHRGCIPLGTLQPFDRNGPTPIGLAL